MPSPSLLRRLRYRLEYAGFRLATGLIRLLPVARAADFSGAAWRRLAPLTSRHARALRHLESALPERSAQEREAIARGMWDNLGRVFAEAVHLDAFTDDPSRIEMPNEEEMRALVARGRGVIAVSLHAGNWEIVSLGVMRAGAQAAGVYQAIKNPYVGAYVTRTRLRAYPGGLHTKGHDTPRKLIRHLRTGGAVAMLADLRDVRGLAVPFFGRPAPSTTFPALLARMHGAPLVAGRVARLPGSRFRLDAVEIAVPRTEDRDADVAVATAAVQRQFETWIRECPDQWMWAHRRWG